MHDGGGHDLVAAVFATGPVPDPAQPAAVGRRAGRRPAEAERAGCTVLDGLLVSTAGTGRTCARTRPAARLSGRELPGDSTAGGRGRHLRGHGGPAQPIQRRVAARSAARRRPRRAGSGDRGLRARLRRALLNGSGERHDRSVKRAIFAAARSADLPGADAGDRSREDVVRFGVALSRYPIRDAVWMAIDDGRIDGRELWRTMALRLPSPYDAAPLFLFGWANWRAGNGALAGIAAERAVASDPALQRGRPAAGRTQPRRRPAAPAEAADPVGVTASRGCTVQCASTLSVRQSAAARGSAGPTLR